jgi:Spy/CpxP family protein refolding chaperone
MTWKRFALIAAALLLIVAAIPLVAQSNSDDPDDYGDQYNNAGDFFAQQGPMGQMGQGHGQMMGRFAEMRKGIPDSLKLTDEQKQKMHDLRSQNQKEMIPMQANLKVMRIELQDLISSGASQSDVNAKIDQIGKLRTDIQKKRVANMMAVRNVLTKEQRDYFKGRMGMGMGNGGGWGDGHGRGGKMRMRDRGNCDGCGMMGPRGGGRGR